MAELGLSSRSLGHSVCCWVAHMMQWHVKEGYPTDPMYNSKFSSVIRASEGINNVHLIPQDVSRVKSGINTEKSIPQMRKIPSVLDGPMLLVGKCVSGFKTHNFVHTSKSCLKFL